MHQDQDTEDCLQIRQFSIFDKFISIFFTFSAIPTKYFVSIHEHSDKYIFGDFNRFEALYFKGVFISFSVDGIWKMNKIKKFVRTGSSRYGFLTATPETVI